MWTDAERRLAEAVSGLSVVNPFLPERMELEWRALGRRPNDARRLWSRREAMPELRPAMIEIHTRSSALATDTARRLRAGERLPERDLRTYQELAFQVLFNAQLEALGALVRAEAPRPFEGWESFRDGWARLVEIPGLDLPAPRRAEHLLGLFYQIQRAVEHIFEAIIGESLAAAELRAAVWQSIFTHDLRRYARALTDRMGDFSTLVVGASGTGKELVARAIGFSRFIPFDPATRSFVEDFRESYFPLNLSALSPTLIESELFGHKRGAFTGAVADRVGWFEQCSARGSVFLDEIGDVAPAIQVKLLRVLQTRRFERLGEAKPREFAGKIVAATHKDLAAEMAAGRFREDLYYRLCADIVRTPGLREQLTDSPGELTHLVGFIARRLAGEEGKALTAEVVAFIEEQLPDYAWPGNFRELEQCVRNVLIRGSYRPPHRPRAEDDALTCALRGERLTADELLNRYCKLTYEQAGSYQEAARRLQLDRRTVKSRAQRAD